VDHHRSYEKLDDSISKLLVEWRSCKMDLDDCFKAKETKLAPQLMIKSIECFIDFIYESNGCSDRESYAIKDLAVKPLNVLERLEFIKSRPGLYHSYIQLSELFAEQEKQYAKHLASMKLKKKRPD
jgi:hypothetical protein